MISPVKKCKNVRRSWYLWINEKIFYGNRQTVGVSWCLSYSSFKMSCSIYNMNTMKECHPSTSHFSKCTKTCSWNYKWPSMKGDFTKSQSCLHNGHRWGADGHRLVTHWYEVESDTKSKTGQTWSHTQRPEVQSDKTWSHSFLQRTLTPSHIMQHWRLNANTTKLESWQYPHYHNISCKVRE